MAHQRSLFVSVSALRNFLLFSCCVLLALGVMCAPAHAQSVTFAGVQTTVPASGLLGPTGVAVDGAGDIFIADTTTTTGWWRFRPVAAPRPR